MASNRVNVVAVASKSRLHILTGLLQRHIADAALIGLDSVGAGRDLLASASPHLLVIDSKFCRASGDWRTLVGGDVPTLVASEDPELDSVELARVDRPAKSVRIFQSESLARVFLAEVGKISAQQKTENEEPAIRKPLGRQRISFPPIRGLDQPAANGRGPAKTARLQLQNGVYDLTKSSLRLVASHAAAERKTGVLKIQNGDRRAEIHFFLGQPHQAQCDGFDGVLALVRFAHWTNGVASWSDEPVSAAAALDSDTARSLMGLQEARA